VAFLSFLAIRYIMSPTNPVIGRMMSHGTAFIPPALSVSGCPNESKMPMISQTIGIRQKVSKRKPVASRNCGYSRGHIDGSSRTLNMHYTTLLCRVDA